MDKSIWLVIWAGVNVVTLLTYGYDKRQARRGGWRVSESTLHVLAAIGGTPGAWAGQFLFRHKTRSRRFLLVFWIIAVVQVLLLLGIWVLRARMG